MRLKESNKELSQKAFRYKTLSLIDKLTGICNREKLENELHNEINRIQRYKTKSFSVVFFDIDNFKHINDTYGHTIGDQVLKLTAQLCQESLRKTDIFARWGGEEFAILMLQTPVAKAEIAAEKLRKVIEQNHIENVGSITCSFGVSEYVDNDDIHTIIDRVDRAMYQAKNEGRNRVKIAER